MATSKQAILQAARNLFSELGFKETTTARIARKAGVSEAAIYKYYKGKDALLDAILGPVVEKYAFQCNARPTRSSTGLECVLAIMEQHEKYVRDNIEDVRILLTCYPLVERLKTHMDDWFSILEDYLRMCLAAGQQDGSILAEHNVDELIHYMEMLLFSMTRFVIYWPDRDYDMAAMMDLCRRSLKA